MRQPTVRTRDIVRTTALPGELWRKVKSRVTHVSRPSLGKDGIAAGEPPLEWFK
jgi:hypothetical protein